MTQSVWLWPTWGIRWDRRIPYIRRPFSKVRRRRRNRKSGRCYCASTSTSSSTRARSRAAPDDRRPVSRLSRLPAAVRRRPHRILSPGVPYQTPISTNEHNFQPRVSLKPPTKRQKNYKKSTTVEENQPMHFVPFHENMKIHLKQIMSIQSFYFTI